VDKHDIVHIIEKIFSWYNGQRPEVKLNPLFDKQKITKKWIDLI